MTSSVERMKQRASRERSARLEAERIAEEKIIELNSAKAGLEDQLFAQSQELKSVLAEREAVLLETSHGVLWDAGEILNAAGADDLDGAIGQVLEVLGCESKALTVGVWEVDKLTLSATQAQRWIAPGPLYDLVGSVPVELCVGSWTDVMLQAEVGSIHRFGVEEVLKSAPSLDDQIDISVGVIVENQHTFKLATMAYFRESSGAKKIDHLLRGITILLRQSLLRVSLEAELIESTDRKSRAHINFMKSASQLMTASNENVDVLVQRTLRETAELLGVPAIVDWSIDYEKRRYRREGSWQHSDVAGREVVETAEFGTRAFLDAARIARKTIQVGSENPTLAEPNRLAAVRGQMGKPSAILVVASLQNRLWNEDEIEVVERLSALLLAAENRLSADSRSTVALEASPIPIVLRRTSDLRLLTCNNAFVELLGAPSREALAEGTPESVIFESIDDVEPQYRSSAQWMFEELAAEQARPGAAAHDVYRGPAGVPLLVRKHCQEVRASDKEPLILVHLEDITERRIAERRLEFLAEHDELTGLMNRRGVLRSIAEMDARSGPGALVVIDLDRFKNVNDSLGHEIGNRLLQEVAGRLMTCLRPGDTVGRLGGDEFVVVLSGPIEQFGAQELVESTIESASSAMQIGSHRLYPSMSAGISFWDSADDANEALIQADTAMYKAKEAGGRCSAVFDQTLRAEVDSKQRLEPELRRALETGQLCVHYQPEVSLRTGEIVGVEALVRWRHPERGLVAAGDFIEAAEEMGFARDIGSFVLQQACLDAASWPGCPVLRVNLAASQIGAETSVFAQVEQILRETGLDKRQLCLEVTETAMIQDFATAKVVLRQLSQLGVHVSLDDFGTGYSSLAYLKHLDVDSLKIDKSFVSDLGLNQDSVKFVHSILSLAKALDLEVVAEGVEDETQARTLRALGCERAQGHLFYEAMPGEEIKQLLQDQCITTNCNLPGNECSQRDLPCNSEVTALTTRRDSMLPMT